MANVGITREDRRLLLEAAIEAVHRSEDLEWVLDDIEFPYRSRPDRRERIAAAWLTVLEELDAGIMRDGYPKLIEALLTRFPANPTFDTLHKRYPPAVPQAWAENSDVATGARAAVAGSGSPVDPPGHVFISYAREDLAEVARLRQALKAAGLLVWQDKEDVLPGDDWPAVVRQAITDGARVFLACFSTRSVTKKKSYQNEELFLAIDQMRLRPPGEPWLIPVRFDDCAIPEFDLGGNRLLSSIQYADLFPGNFDAGASRLAEVIRRILAR